MLNQFDEVVRVDDPKDAGIVVHRVHSFFTDEVYRILWYSGGYEDTAYESEVKPTGRNYSEDFKKAREKKH